MWDATCLILFSYPWSSLNHHRGQFTLSRSTFPWGWGNQVLWGLRMYILRVPVNKKKIINILYKCWKSLDHVNPLLGCLPWPWHERPRQSSGSTRCAWWLVKAGGWSREPHPSAPSKCAPGQLHCPTWGKGEAVTPPEPGEGSRLEKHSKRSGWGMGSRLPSWKILKAGGILDQPTRHKENRGFRGQ